MSMSNLFFSFVQSIGFLANLLWFPLVIGLVVFIISLFFLWSQKYKALGIGFFVFYGLTIIATFSVSAGLFFVIFIDQKLAFGFATVFSILLLLNGLFIWKTKRVKFRIIGILLPYILIGLIPTVMGY